MLTKDEFLRNYQISQEQFEAAQMSWETLTDIYEDYCGREPVYDEAAADFKAEIFSSPREEFGLHSVYWRVKDAEHLIAKIIRKRTTNYKRYKNIGVSNYGKIVTDLVGFRGLLVFKEDWPRVHVQLGSHFLDDPQLYMDTPGFVEYDKDTESHYAEPPTAHIREGDNKILYQKLLGSENIVSKQNYRSVHYVIWYHNVYVELQIRTLFEEAFAEMDHKIRYPNLVADGKLTRYAGIVNHLAGAADELGSFYLELAGESPDMEQFEQTHKSRVKIPFTEQQAAQRTAIMDTPGDCLKNTLQQ